MKRIAPLLFLLMLATVGMCAQNSGNDAFTDADGKADAAKAWASRQALLGAKPVQQGTSESKQEKVDASTADGVVNNPKLFADAAAVQTAMDGMAAKLNELMAGYNNPDDMRQRMIATNGADFAAGDERSKASGSPASHFYPVANDYHRGQSYGLEASAYKTPQHARVPGQITVFENTDYAADFNKQANKAADKVENFLEDKLGLGGCGDFAFGAEFTMLFNKEVLQDFLTNLQQGVIAAAPMAILTALSPELANIIQHLKAMAAMALQIASGDCSMIQGIMTDQLTKAFNGKDWEECMTSANASGNSKEEGNALCRNKRAVLGDGAASFMGLGIPQMGVALDDFLNNASDSVASGKPYSEVAAARTALATAGEAKLDDLTASRTAYRNSEESRAIIVNDPSNYEIVNGQQQLKASSYADIALIDADVAQKKIAYEATVKDVTATTKYLDPSNAVKCLNDPGCRAGVVPGYKDRGGAAAVSTYDEFISGASSAYDSIMGSNPVTGFLQEYLKQTVGPLKLSAGFEVGNYNFRFDIKRKAFGEVKLAMELEAQLPALWTAYKNCDKAAMDSTMMNSRLLLYGLMSNPWRQTEAGKDILYRNRATNISKNNPGATVALGNELLPRELVNSPLSEMSDTTILKLAHQAYRMTFASTEFGKWAYMSDITTGGGSTWTGGGASKESADINAGSVNIAAGRGFRVVCQQLTKGAVSYFTLQQMEQDSKIDTQLKEIQKAVEAAANGDDSMKAVALRNSDELDARVMEVTSGLLKDIAGSLPYIMTANAIVIDEKPQCAINAFMYTEGGASSGTTITPSTYDEFVK